MFLSRFMPCSECGDSIDRTVPLSHQCDPDRRAAYVMLSMREEIEAFDDQLQCWLVGTDGSFEAWMAARQVRRSR